MGRSHSDDRCSRCRMGSTLCLCPVIPEVKTKTRVVILMHWRESLTTTNTGRLAHLSLPNSEIRYRGKIEPMSSDGLVSPEFDSVFLYPSDDSSVLNEQELAHLRRPLTLIVPDGNWRQAHRVMNREPALAHVKRVRLAPGRPSEYALRREPNLEAVCTFEAIARALGVIEGNSVQQSLEMILKIMVSRTLWSRGKIRDEECFGGLPSTARRG